MSLRSKLHRFTSGRVQGGKPFSRGQIYALLRNPIYIGKIRHKARVWDGQHEAIIDEVTWQRVQELMRTNGTGAITDAKVQSQIDILNEEAV